MFDDCSDRLLLFNENLNDPDKQVYGKEEAAKTKTVGTYEEANLISSQCAGGDGTLHAPVIDFDYPIEVYPSSQIGHNHLYINKKISWNKYKKVLKALADAELIEKGHAAASIAKGYSAVRPIGVVKPDAPSGVNVLIENAKLRQQNYKLRQERDYLLKLTEQLQKDANPPTKLASQNE